MFVAIPSRHRSGWRWATPLLFTALWVAFVAQALADADEHLGLLHEWGALSGALVDVHAWRTAWSEGAALRLVTALLLHADWSHLLGNLVFLLGGAVANLAAVASVDTPDRIIIGASGAVSAVIGAYLALFPNAKLGVVLPLGLFLQFVRAPAPLLIGIWALLQVLFTFFGPAFGAVAWVAHLMGFLFGVVFALVAKAGIARRLRKQRGL